MSDCFFVRLAQNIFNPLERECDGLKLASAPNCLQSCGARKSVNNAVAPRRQDGIDHIVSKTAHFPQIELQPLAKEAAKRIFVFSVAPAELGPLPPVNLPCLQKHSPHSDLKLMLGNSFDDAICLPPEGEGIS